MPSCIHRSRYIYIFFRFRFHHRMIRSFLFYHYLSLLSIYCLFFLNFVHEDFQREREEKEERERAREIHRIRYEFRTSLDELFIRCLLLLVVVVLVLFRDSLKIRFFFVPSLLEERLG